MVLQIIAATMIWLMSLIGGRYAFYMRQRLNSSQLLRCAEAFAGGIFLGAALFHMLPDAQTALALQFHGNYPLANLICAAGFCLLLFLEKLTHDLAQLKSTVNLLPILMTALISIHALSEGIALGVNQTTASMMVIFIAIIVHKSSEGFAVSLQLQRSTLTKRTLMMLFLVFSLMSPLGILMGILTQTITNQQTSVWLLGIFNAFAAGTFLYLATLHKLYHQHGKQHAQLHEFWATLVGLLLMAMVAIWM